MARPRVDPIKRFWEHVTVAGSDDCWEWNSAKDKNGYGMFQIAGPRKTLRAHRFSYALYSMKGDPIAAVLSLQTKDFIIHSCDNTGCVNPNHLSKATVLINNRDKMKKGRHVVWNKDKKLGSTKGSKISAELRSKRAGFPQRNILNTLEEKSNGTSSKELNILFGFPNRKIQSAIVNLRKRGHNIISTGRNGLFILVGNTG